MKRIVVTSLAAVSILALAACGKYHGHYGEKYYKNSDDAVKTINVPHGMSSPVGKQLYPVPKIENNKTANVSLLPPDPNYHAAVRELKLKKKK